MATKAKFPGFADRLRTAMQRAGYWYADRAEPNVLRFCIEKGHVSQYLYAYLTDNRTPDLERLKKMAGDLHVPMAWLLMGDEAVEEIRRLVEAPPTPPHRRGTHRGRRRAPVSIRGGSDQVLTIPTSDAPPTGRIMSSCAGHRARREPFCSA